MLAALALTGCATPSAPDYGGSWKPVNRYAATTTEIPLAQAYEFYASPMDGTLKTMLTRWSATAAPPIDVQTPTKWSSPTVARKLKAKESGKALPQMPTWLSRASMRKCPTRACSRSA